MKHAMNTDQSKETATSPAERALIELQLPPHEGGPEHRVAVQALAGLLTKLRKIDLTLDRARALLIVLQPERDGRIDLRRNQSRSIEGGCVYCFVQWQGGGSRQYARKLPTATAYAEVQRGRASARTTYASARRLAKKIATLLWLRAAVIRAIHSLRRSNKRVHGADAIEQLGALVVECTPRALTMLAIYAATSSGAQSARSVADKQTERSTTPDALN